MKKEKSIDVKLFRVDGDLAPFVEVNYTISGLPWLSVMGCGCSLTGTIVSSWTGCCLPT